MAAVAVITAAGLAWQVYQGVKQEQEAKKMMANNTRPNYAIPEEFFKALSSAEDQARQRLLPGQSLIEEEVGATTSRGADELKDTAGSGVDASGGIVQLYAKELDARRDIGLAAANNFNTNQQVLRTMQGVIGRARDNSFNINEMQPYLANAAAAGALHGAGQQNIAGGIGGLTTVAGAYMDNRNPKKAKEDVVTPDNTRKTSMGTSANTVNLFDNGPDQSVDLANYEASLLNYFNNNSQDYTKPNYGLNYSSL